MTRPDETLRFDAADAATAADRSRPPASVDGDAEAWRRSAEPRPAGIARTASLGGDDPPPPW
jgi:hypothetical protein